MITKLLFLLWIPFSGRCLNHARILRLSISFGLLVTFLFFSLNSSYAIFTIPIGRLQHSFSADNFAGNSSNSNFISGQTEFSLAGPGSTNQPPVTINEHIQLCGNSVSTGTVFNGDQDPENTLLTASTIPLLGPAHGTFSLDASGNFIYNPFAGYSGTDLVVVSICDSGIPPVCANDTLFISVDAFIQANAGIDQQYCNANSFSLSGNVPASGSTAWTTVSGPNMPLIAPSNSTTAAVTGIIAAEQPYIFQYTITNGLCVSSDQLTILNSAPPTISFAGNDQNLCLATPGTINLNANPAVTGSGIWTQIVGPATSNITNPSDPATSVSGIMEGLYIFDWTITNGDCDPSSSAVFIQITQPADAFAGNDTTITNSQPSLTIASSSVAHNSDLIWSTSGTGTFDDPATLHPTYTPSSADRASGSVTLTLSCGSTSPCPGTDDQMVLSFGGQLTAFAGQDAESCQGTSFTLSTSSASNYNSLIWSHNGSGILQSPNELHPTYIPSINESGLITLTLKAFGQNPATDSIQDEVTLLIHPLPTAVLGNDASICEGETALLNVEFTGTSPWSFTYTDGTSNTTITGITSNPYSFSIQPETTQLVSLTSVTDANCQGSSAQLSGSAFITVNSVPVPAFQYQASCGNLLTSFFDASSTPSGSQITSWHWDFGISGSSADTSSIQNPQFLYLAEGNYQVSLTVTSATGCQASSTMPVVVRMKPTAKFDFTVSPCSHGNVQFHATEPGSAINWEWEFETGKTATGQNPGYTFPILGQAYPVRLITTFQNGCVDTTFQLVQVPAELKASIEAMQGCVSTSSSFTATPELPAGDEITSFSWNFGDAGSGINNNSTLQDPEHTYEVPGTYIISLTITDKFECSITTSKAITLNPLPQASFNWSENTFSKSVSFTSTSSSSSVAISKYSWDFGDESNQQLLAPENTITHTYSNAGQYKVTHKVADKNGCMASISEQILVSTLPNPEINLSDTVICQGTSIEVMNPEYDSTAKWTWNWGDGTEPITLQTYSPSVSHIYKSAGNFIISLEIVLLQNDLPITLSADNSIQVNPSPKVRIESEGRCPGQETHFSGINENQNNSDLQCNWTINDNVSPSFSTASSPSHTFEKAGNYLISLKATNNLGCSDSSYMTLNISPAPLSAFRIENASRDQQGKIRLINGSLNTSQVLWDLGNGETNIDDSPVVMYNEDGKFHITLYATNSSGCTDSTSLDYDLLIKSLFVPSAFAPADATAANQQWKPVGLNLATYKVQVFDRYNHLMWASEELDEKGSPIESWDGTFQGKDCRQGVYLWNIYATFKDGTVWENQDIGNHLDLYRQKSGTITLIR
ncbi:MAG: PKD domain-containing protein [Bacteroidetes bacterium]|nr:PKD domain-containing protein [Bacteroidota bacterium]